MGKIVNNKYYSYIYLRFLFHIFGIFVSIIFLIEFYKKIYITFGLLILIYYMFKETKNALIKCLPKEECFCDNRKFYYKKILWKFIKLKSFSLDVGDILTIEDRKKIEKYGTDNIFMGIVFYFSYMKERIKITTKDRKIYYIWIYNKQEDLLSPFAPPMEEKNFNNEIDNFEDFNVEQVFKKGRLMYDNGKLKTFPSPEVDEFLASRAHNTFKVDKLTSEAFKIDRPRGVLGMIPGELMTTDEGYATGVDVDADILKIAVVERHNYTGHIGIGYIKGYGLKSGAVATSISHDSHNIIVVGTNDSDMADAVNHIAENDGGITVYDNGRCIGDVQLAIAGLMSDAPLVDVNRALETAKEKAFGLGINRSIDPFMTLSFMSLPVIPKLRLTTRGVFDVESQSYV